MNHDWSRNKVNVKSLSFTKEYISCSKISTVYCCTNLALCKKVLDHVNKWFLVNCRCWLQRIIWMLWNNGVDNIKVRRMIFKEIERLVTKVLNRYCLSVWSMFDVSLTTPYFYEQYFSKQKWSWKGTVKPSVHEIIDCWAALCRYIKIT